MTEVSDKIEVGQNRFYKTNGGRGRPFVGEILALHGFMVQIKNARTGEVMNVNRKYIRVLYTFTPYIMKDVPRKPYTRKVSADTESVSA